MLNIIIKSFQELSNQELYAILQLRSAVFVVEQDCVYQDLDGKDEKAMHLLGIKSNKVIAYVRIFKPGDYFKEASIGRVVVAKNERQFKYGYDIMNASLKYIKEDLHVSQIKISAQVYLRQFYTKLGFEAVGEEYLEDDIPHIAMMYHLKK